MKQTHAILRSLSPRAARLESRNGHLSAQALSSRLMGSATYDGLSTGFDANDVGAGPMVAPQGSG